MSVGSLTPACCQRVFASASHQHYGALRELMAGLEIVVFCRRIAAVRPVPQRIYGQHLARQIGVRQGKYDTVL